MLMVNIFVVFLEKMQKDKERLEAMKKTALIMAGGRGERFWPKSRKSLPKQFLSLTDDGRTMIQLTVERIRPLIDLEDIYISTNRAYRGLVMEQLPGIPPENILCEPVGRNTAPCIGLGAVHIAKKYEDAVMMVLPSDHLIKYNQMFLNALKDGCSIAEKGKNLVTIGITPDYPETGYGYIKFLPQQADGNAYAVDRFVEKPDMETAKEYLESEEYLWNSGMFIWKVSTILDNMKSMLPDLHQGLFNIAEAIGTDKQEMVLEKVFPELESVSIDYGVMEKAENIFILPGVFGWDDVGSWLAVERIQKSNESGNVVTGNIITINSKNNIIQGGKKLIAAVGLENLIIVDTEDATLICDKGSTPDIKLVLENLKICNREEYL
jgi:mannose-1-phosphate guanylyltransferase